ncbi:hypothetical protein ACIRP3_00915 [Streptomyces sp. NPDC101209]|uniref:hypothetical protein n=1 Tax=Streptomyces sp. NPDC101209 TaxID=3366129 RepID=UPI00381E3C31
MSRLFQAQLAAYGADRLGPALPSVESIQRPATRPPRRRRPPVHPHNGRFNHPDPATPERSSPYVSAYVYSGNTPTLCTDPSGLSPDDPTNGHVDSRALA